MVESELDKALRRIAMLAATALAAARSEGEVLRALEQIERAAAAAQQDYLQAMGAGEPPVEAAEDDIPY